MPVPVPISVVRRAFDQMGLIMGDRAGAGKSAVVYWGRKGVAGRLRAVRIVSLGEDFNTEIYVDVVDSLEKKHALIRDVLGNNVPRLYTSHLVPSKHGNRTLAAAFVMSAVEGKDFTEYVRRADLIARLRKLLQKLWRNRISHGDLVDSNILYDNGRQHWVLIDLSDVMLHDSEWEARVRDLTNMSPSVRSHFSQDV